ncbi:MAG TPA: glycosyltransferase [Anaerolineales bacterium]|nr:glycosyltransferase [Anaerolineales bacterium]
MVSYHTCPLATLGGKDTGGMNVYVRELTRFLGKAGIHVDVFTRSQDEHVPHVLHDLGYGNRVVHISAGPEVPLPKHELVSFLPEFTQGILTFAENKGLTYDLIHSHYWMSGITAEELKNAWGVPVIQMFHTLGVMKQRVARVPTEVEGDYRLQGEHRVMEVSDRIVAATPAELAQLQWLYQIDTKKITVIPPGVDLGHFYPIEPDEAKEFIGIAPCEQVLLFVGRIEPLKGIDTLIEALSIMHQKDVRVCLSVIGGNPEDDLETQDAELMRLQSLRGEYGLTDLIAFLGKRGQDTLPYYYSAAIAVVVPSYYESFGMVALEAMACGTPVVASQVGGLAFLVQDGYTGYTVPVDEPQALADRLTTLLQDPELRAQMGSQAANFAKQFGWEQITKQIINLYQEVTAKRI